MADMRKKKKPSKEEIEEQRDERLEDRIESLEREDIVSGGIQEAQQQLGTQRGRTKVVSGPDEARKHQQMGIGASLMSAMDKGRTKELKSLQKKGTKAPEFSDMETRDSTIRGLEKRIGELQELLADTTLTETQRKRYTKELGERQERLKKQNILEAPGGEALLKAVDKLTPKQRQILKTPDPSAPKPPDELTEDTPNPLYDLDDPEKVKESPKKKKSFGISGMG